jgi:hypothetical protein
MTAARRRRLPHLRSARDWPSRLDTAYDFIDRVRTALEMTILVRDVLAGDPVRVLGTFIHGRSSVEVVAEGATEAAALVELARKAALFRGRDEQWFLRYGLGA